MTGNIRSGLLSSIRGGSDGSSQGLLNTFGNAFKTKHYTFPIDVESGRETGNHGHYMIFFINQQQPPSLNFNTPQRLLDAANKNLKKAEKQSCVDPQDVMYADGPTRAAAEQETADQRYQETLVSRSQTVSVKRRPTTRLDTLTAGAPPPAVLVLVSDEFSKVCSANAG